MSFRLIKSLPNIVPYWNSSAKLCAHFHPAVPTFLTLSASFLFTHFVSPLLQNLPWSPQAGLVFGVVWLRFCFTMSPGQQVRQHQWGTRCFQMLTSSIWEHRYQMRSATLLTQLLLPLLEHGISCSKWVRNPHGSQRIERWIKNQLPGDLEDSK